jgi:deleted-in-malignant-brain-tumors protein 1
MNGITDAEGRVEVYRKGHWEAVCDYNWDIREARVVCRQLHYAAGMGFPRNSYYGRSSAPIWKVQVNCTGTEASLHECRVLNANSKLCNHRQEAGVICGNPTVRLVDGPSPDEGRVEVYQNGQWGTVCDDRWSIVESGVVCRQLGYSRAKHFYRLAYYGRGSGAVLMDDVRCAGNEVTLESCEHLGPGQGDCSHKEDVGVHCTDDT